MKKYAIRRRVTAVMLVLLMLIILNLLSFTLFRPAREQIREQLNHLPMPLSRMAISKKTTFHGECHSAKLYNKTWGRSVAPFVDKIASKQIVRDMHTSVSIPKTLAIYDEGNVSQFTATTARNLPDSMIKPSMGSGHDAKIVDGVYTCFKRCHIENTPHDFRKGTGKLAIQAARKEMKHILIAGGVEDVAMEPQYSVGPWRVLIEERLDIDDFLEVHWWVSNGQPVFVCVRCDKGGHMRGTYYTSDFRELKIGTLKKCPHLKKPKTWDRMLSIIREMGKHIPGIVCIDLYANDDQVYFSEFTFTRNMCQSLMSPAAADALLYVVGSGLVAPQDATPTYVQRAMQARSWVDLVFNPDEPLLESNHGLVIAARSPTSLDVCLRQRTEQVDACTQRVAPVASYPLHCVVEQRGNISAIGLEVVPTIPRILERLDWPWALGVAVLAAILTFHRKADEPEKEHLQVGNWCAYVALMTVYKCMQSHFAGVVAPTPLMHTVVQSFEIFKLVHPVTSTAVALSHFSSYWCPVAALLVRKRSTMLWMFLCYEIGTAFVNEYAHFEEADNGVRCMRVSYIQHAKQYALNDVVRVYMLPPFFVYGYLLPKMILYWAGFINP